MADPRKQDFAPGEGSDDWLKPMETLDRLTEDHWRLLDLAIQDTKSIFGGGYRVTVTEIESYMEDALGEELFEDFPGVPLIFLIGGYLNLDHLPDSPVRAAVAKLKQSHEAWLTHVVTTGSRPRDWSRLGWAKVDSTLVPDIRLQITRVDGEIFELEFGAESGLGLASRIAGWIADNEYNIGDGVKYAESFQQIAEMLREKSAPHTVDPVTAKRELPA